MPLYAKFMKDLLAKKRNWKKYEIVVLTKECIAIIQKNFPKNLKDPGSFFIPCTIGEVTIERALCDLVTNINLMPLSLMRKLQIDEVEPTKISLQLADRSIKFPLGVVENLLLKVGTFIFPANFVILDMEEDINASIILGRPFLATRSALIDAMQHPSDSEDCIKIDLIDPLVQEALEEKVLNDSLEPPVEDGIAEIDDCPLPKEVIHVPNKEEGTPKLDLKSQPPFLKYAFLGEKDSYPVKISSFLSTCEEELLKILKDHKSAPAWTIGNLKEISPAMYMHNI
ncbi:uncharacterized protein LOC107620772 [Arachis ipaensis]|uniref:uncharacterized protein LOC107620772 n=1 Tax=Arachis ipaensis TaxID=130454 RepID=UPI0007AF6316|nr:uncharacterized protein LOC107620772 [Arachis ipaensis]XP_025685238.1 uncharacterized protein LOC112786028 [Arachis hypogaea]